MKDLVFKKKCNAGTLHKELVGAGFLLHGVSTWGFPAEEGEKEDPTTVIHLVDEETKDPASIVEAHVYVEPPTLEEIEAEWKRRFESAKTVDEQVLILAERVGLKETGGS